jgi:hypothetical protein
MSPVTNWTVSFPGLDVPSSRDSRPSDCNKSGPNHHSAVHDSVLFVGCGSSPSFTEKEKAVCAGTCGGVVQLDQLS